MPGKGLKTLNETTIENDDAEERGDDGCKSVDCFLVGAGGCFAMSILFFCLLGWLFAKPVWFYQFLQCRRPVVWRQPIAGGMYWIPQMRWC